MNNRFQREVSLGWVIICRGCTSCTIVTYFAHQLSSETGIFRMDAKIWRLIGKNVKNGMDLGLIGVTSRSRTTMQAFIEMNEVIIQRSTESVYFKKSMKVFLFEEDSSKT